MDNKITRSTSTTLPDAKASFVFIFNVFRQHVPLRPVAISIRLFPLLFQTAYVPVNAQNKRTLNCELGNLSHANTARRLFGLSNMTLLKYVYSRLDNKVSFRT